MKPVNWLNNKFLFSYSIIYNVNKYDKLAGNFDNHAIRTTRRKSHCLMKHIRGFTRRLWMLSLGKCPHHIAPVAAMVIVVGVSKKHNTQPGFT
jgi:hypothetical protein